MRSEGLPVPMVERLPADLAGMLRDAVLEGDEGRATELARKVLADGIDPMAAIEEGLVPGIRRMGQLFDEGQAFLPELMMAGRTMKAAADILGEAIRDEGGGGRGSRHVVVLGTVKGDLHEIGKNIVGVLLEAAGYDVVDLGMDVDAGVFAEAAAARRARVVGASALLTTTMRHQREVVARVREAGTAIKVIVGGAPVNEEWARDIGADGYAENAKEAVDLVDRLLGGGEGGGMG